MNRILGRLKIAFVAFFAICCVAVWSIHLIFVWPGQRCEANEMWWDWRTRTCAMPVPLHMFTGRNPDGTPREIVPESTTAQTPTSAPSASPASP
jgi:hypothetical protein